MARRFDGGAQVGAFDHCTNDGYSAVDEGSKRTTGIRIVALESPMLGAHATARMMRDGAGVSAGSTTAGEVVTVFEAEAVADRRWRIPENVIVG
ncbi:MAG TPA: hypothetical protein VG368_02510 [Acidimicrobiales bacterium]|nr:hypothetical protein [Acidimicrobiales bacterium]